MSKKKQQLLITATELFSAHGFRRITIDEICKTSNISKMTFYKYFKNKIDIGKVVLDTIYSQGKLRYYEMLKQDIPFSDKIENMLLISRTQTHAIGPSFFLDITDKTSPLLSYFLEKQKEIKNITIDFCRNAQKTGQIRKDISIDVMMFMLNSQYEQLNHPDFVESVPDVEDRCSMLASLFFYGFTGSSA
jgi:AcrR family transcriptional regulator